jgi:hypothetical protein
MGRHLSGIAGRRQTAQCLLQSFLVVSPSPSFDRGTRMQPGGEPVLVEAFVARATVEGFGGRVLVRRARPGEPAGSDPNDDDLRTT